MVLGMRTSPSTSRVCLAASRTSSLSVRQTYTNWSMLSLAWATPKEARMCKYAVKRLTGVGVTATGRSTYPETG